MVVSVHQRHFSNKYDVLQPHIWTTTFRFNVIQRILVLRNSNHIVHLQIS